jgi:hypothetical protein
LGPLGQEFWILMSSTLFSLLTGRVQEPGPRVECSVKISMFYISRIFFQLCLFFFSFCPFIYFQKGGNSATDFLTFWIFKNFWRFLGRLVEFLDFFGVAEKKCWICHPGSAEIIGIFQIFQDFWGFWGFKYFQIFFEISGFIGFLKKFYDFRGIFGNISKIFGFFLVLWEKLLNLTTPAALEKWDS